jgi:hypothetical protein
MTTFLTLGPVTFANFEVPERINFGGAQALSVKQLVGGARIIDAMGRIDNDISWSGLFFGSTAMYRAQYLDTLRTQGAPLPLTFANFNYSVVIKEFSCSFERTYQMPYRITCTVIQDLNKPISMLLPVGYNDAINNIMTEANDLALLIANPSISSAMALLSAAIQAIPSIQNASRTDLIPVVNQLVLTQNAVTSATKLTAAAIPFGKVTP